MAKTSIEKYKKNVGRAMKGIISCQYSTCRRCPYRGKGGCRSRLFEETADFLADYLVNMKEMKEE